ncbi:MAG: copper chaperone PCu(A)C [Alphaproteobacteria bacterium]|nr:copper chaperone PCu(A)C [Alphaproteobacteria bacterium]
MLRLISVSLAALVLAACGDSRSTDTAEMDHGSMQHGAVETSETDSLAPLPDDGTVTVVNISQAWMRPHPGGRDVTAAYFTASLAEGSADRLVAARIDGAERVELHTHTMNDQGMMQMREIPAADLTGEGDLEFRPGGLHLMVFGLATVVEGDQVSGELDFERAGTIAVTFPVQINAPADE